MNTTQIKTTKRNSSRTEIRNNAEDMGKLALALLDALECPNLYDVETIREELQDAQERHAYNLATR